MAERNSGTFTDEERAAMKARSKELKAAGRRTKGADSAEAEAEVLAKIGEMGDSDRAMAERLHALIKATAPDISPRTYYGMPAYAKDGQVICFFKNAGKFKTRYSTLGFSDKAHLDDGTMWATDFALMDLSAANEARIIELVKRAVS